jgi:serine/threonine protein kinase
MQEHEQRLKLQSHSLDELRLLRSKKTNKLQTNNNKSRSISCDVLPRPKIPLTTISQKIPTFPQKNVESPREKILELATVEKLKQIGKGYASGTIIWEVNVILNVSSVVFPNIVDWKNKIQHCCMKEIVLESATQYEIDSFVLEIENLKRLPENHDNIMQFLGFQMTSQYYRVFTRLYDGTFSDVLKARIEPFSFHEVLELSKQVCSALMVIHSRRMMHRDIKSSNIFYLGNPNSINELTLVLGDYGESKCLSLTNRAKTCVGTNVWMAPEVLLGKSKVEYSFAADMYSFGMFIYELMTLKSPYYECKAFASVKKIMDEEKPRLTELELTTYKGIIDMWTTLVDHNIDNRPPAAKTFCMLTDFINHSNDIDTLSSDVCDVYDWGT